MLTSLSDRAGFLVAANLIKYAVGFIMPMVLVRLLSQSEYGSYQQMILIGGAAIGVLTLGLPTSVYYFYHHVERQRVAALVAQTTLLLCVAGLLASLLVFSGARHFAASLNNPALATLLPLYAVGLALTIGSEHCLHVMISQDRYGLAVLFEIIETVVRVLTLLLPLWLGYGLTGLVAGVVLYAALRFLVRNGYLLRRGGLDFAGWRGRAFARRQLAYCLPVALVSLSTLVGATFNRAILAMSFSPAQYAVYAVGALEIPLDVIFQASVANVLRASLPPLVRDGNLVEVVRILREATRKLSIIVLPSFVFLFCHSAQFIQVLFTSSYEDSVHVFRLYLWLMPLHMLVLSTVPHVFGMPKLNLYIALATMTLLLVLGYALLKTVGFYGPAIAMLLAEYVQTALYLLVVTRLTKASLARLLPLRHIALVGLAALLAALVSTRAGHLTPSALLNLVLAGAVFSVTFFLAAIPLGVFSRDDVRLIRRWAAKVLPIAPG
ncbi:MULTISPECIES: lipopolysaccharide biosynthesis protein [unclassified Janthinobacterium]|uniref:lipopolysaccharide biosynthesis protein n=1 Tax=unclassified Janthinobacterium TaxID=2610881 RepID=UPI0012F8D498|nr:MULTISPECIES: oligosaccharide flippase family protein [unclassified Janthinobacterium]MEC5161198.1 O-antigen/teichoic acid export membrane protein [Janthinobacterium sp. CG_S6]